MTMETITWQDFQKIALHVGTVLRAEEFPEAHKPAYKLWIDLGPELGTKKSSAQITDRYARKALVGRQVVCVTNLGPRQIGPFMSQVLVTGFYGDDDTVVLAGPDEPVPNGARLC